MKYRRTYGKIAAQIIFGLILMCALLAGAALAESSGTCGAGLSWALSDDGVLTVSGTGDMSENAGWDKDSILKIIIEEGVTGIADSAFSKCAKLTDVSLPESLTVISARAFLNCEKLTGVALPSRLQKIGFSAFAHCSSLTEIIVPASVTLIDPTAFDECSALNRLVVAEGNPSYISVDGLVYNQTCETLILVPNGRTGTVTLPASVSALWGTPFDYCAKLGGIAVADGNSAYSAADGILYSVDKTELIAVPKGITGSVSVAEGVMDIPSGAFSGCGSLMEITLPASVRSVGSYAFSDCAALTEIRFGSGTSALSGSLFSGCSALKGITLPASISSIDPWMMNGSSLTRVDVAAYNPVYESRDSLVYRKGGTALVACPPARTGHLTIPSSVTKIETYAFYRSRLFLITVPASVTSIEIGAFSSNQIQALILLNPDVQITAEAAHREYPLLREEAGQIARGMLYGYAGSTAKAHADRYGIPFMDLSSMTGSWIQNGSVWYYLKSDLSLADGWLEIGGTWYYFTGGGAMATGWLQAGGSWYYLDDSGAMIAPGWQQIGGNWYYFADSGAMASGWRKISGDWYYFADSGAMASGWRKISGDWYYFADSGAMISGWRKIGGIWYHFGSSGSMTVGWLQTGGKWYYFQDSGAMVTGWKEIKGQWEYFGNDGAWQYTWTE